MDPEQTFLRVHARLSGVLARLLTPKFRAVLEYLCLFNALMLLALLVVMHVNFVAQPACSMEFSGADVADAQLVQIKITGSWNRISEDALSQLSFGTSVKDPATNDKLMQEKAEPLQPLLDQQVPGGQGEGWNILGAKFWLNLISTNARRSQAGKWSWKTEREPDSAGHVNGMEDTTQKSGSLEETPQEIFAEEVSPRALAGPGRGPIGTALLHYMARWSTYTAVCLKRAEQSLRSFWQVWRITGWEPFAASPKGDRRSVAWNKLDSVLVDFSDKRRQILDPTYLYSVEKGYLMLSEAAKVQHSIRTVNVTISAQNLCFGNRWQQLLIDNFVGYDTILMNSLLHARGKGYLYNFQTKELYNLNYLQDFSGVAHGFEDYIVFKCGVLITSLFVFFTTTMSVSFTLRETQARMLKFTVQLQHHARHRLPTYRLIFVHVIESLVFVPIMIGILFFLFEFFDDQLLAFMVLTLVWLCELYTMISVRTPLSMQYFPRFFFLYFMVFHIYFFSYTYGFSYLAFSATGAFMQHLVLYFWNQFEVPALQSFLRRRALFQQQGLHISSAILQVARLTNGSLLGDARNMAVDPGGQRAGSPPNSSRNPGNDTQHGDRSQANPVLERNGDRNNRSSQPPTLYPLSFRNLGTFSADSGTRMFDSSRNQSSGLSSLIPNPSDVFRGELDRSRTVGVDRDGGESGMSSSVGRTFREPGAESQVPVGEATNSGPLTSLGSVLPWILGSGPATLVSFLPIFRDFRDVHQQLATPATTDQDGEDRASRGGLNNDPRLRRRPIPML
ncbi:unnamed protein product [Calypogeia fissa]